MPDRPAFGSALAFGNARLFGMLPLCAGANGKSDAQDHKGKKQNWPEKIQRIVKRREGFLHAV
jgi:hypothetical protein